MVGHGTAFGFGAAASALHDGSALLRDNFCVGTGVRPGGLEETALTLSGAAW